MPGRLDGVALPRLGTDAFAEVMGAGGNDVAVKRNLGLLIARVMGWSRILFVDDDVRGMTIETMAEAASGLVRHGAAGWAFSDFNDNSVACHAARLAGTDLGLLQDTFIGGGALGVRVDADTPFFPRAYNEDWLFVHEYVARDSVVLLGNMIHMAYDPFGNTELALAQEIADMLAEGLFRSFHTGAAAEGGAVLSDDYWRDIVDLRIRYIEQTAAELMLAPEIVDPAHPKARALSSLTAARALLDDVAADLLARYARQWRSDLEAWAAHWKALPVGLGYQEALRELGLEAYTRDIPAHRRAVRRAGWRALAPVSVAFPVGRSPERPKQLVAF